MTFIISTRFYFFLSVLFFSTTLSFSQTLDPSFDGDGWALGGLNMISNSYVWNCGVQSDNKVISFIQRSGLGTEIIRFNENGSVDGSFNNITTSGPNEARAIIVDPADNFYIAYRTGFPGSTIIKYDANGIVDNSFVSLTTDFTVFRLEIGPAGALFALGARYTDAVIAEISLTGALVGTFGTGGMTTLGTGLARDLVVDISGNIIVLVHDFPNTKIAKLNSLGVLSGSFGTAGIGTYNNTDELFCLDIHSVSGGYVAVGSFKTAGSSSLGSFKIDINGNLDPTYGSGGYANLGVNGRVPGLNQGSVLCGNSNNVALLYEGGTLSNMELGIIMVQPDGSMNPAFGTLNSGSEIFGFTSPIQQSTLSIDNLGRLLVNSSTTISTTVDILVSRIEIPAIFNTPLASVSVYGSLYVQSFLQLTPLAVDPGCSSSADQGRIYFDKGLQKLRVCTNTGWQALH